jgi:DNA-binding CsgD family transcriptional regulator
MRFDAIRAVEACYAGSDDPAWLRGLVDVIDTLGPSPRAFGQIFTGLPGGPRLVLAVATGGFAPALRAMNEESQAFARCAPADVLRRIWAMTPSVDYAMRRAARIGAPAIEYQRSQLGRAGEEDAVLLFADGGGGTIGVLGRGVDGGSRVSARTWQQLTRLAAHLGSALRLRRAIFAGGAPGALDGAATPTGGARALPPRSLTDAARRGAGAAGLLRRADPEEALRIWQGLVDGSWSLVDRCDSDGRRYVLLRRKEPGVRDPTALTAREGSIVAYAALGHQNKAIAYLLGVSPSAVASHLASARRKLGLASRAELIGLFGALLSPDRER